MSTVLRNVFDFDRHSSNMLDIALTTLHKHGIPVGASLADIHLATELVKIYVILIYTVYDM